MFKCVFIYISGNTDDVTVGMCLCALFTASNVVHYWMNVYCSVVWINNVPIKTTIRYRYICVHIYVILYNYIKYGRISCGTLFLLNDALFIMYAFSCCRYVLLCTASWISGMDMHVEYQSIDCIYT